MVFIECGCYIYFWCFKIQASLIWGSCWGVDSTEWCLGARGGGEYKVLWRSRPSCLTTKSTGTTSLWNTTTPGDPLFHCPPIHPLIHSFTHLFICSSVHPFIHQFVLAFTLIFFFHLFVSLHTPYSSTHLRLFIHTSV